MKNFLDDKNAAYDALAKKVLSRKAILAQILELVFTSSVHSSKFIVHSEIFLYCFLCTVHCCAATSYVLVSCEYSFLKFSVKEFSDCTLEDIEQKYIEGDPTLTINTVPLDDTLYIKGRNAESKSPSEGLVTFDIIFDAFMPMDGEKAKFIINVEPQKTTQNIHYKLMKRAVYYAARLISSQKEKEFHGDDFNNLKKIFSIWVCMNVQNYRADSIQEYRLAEKVLHGKFHDKLKNYNLITIIILNLGKNSTTHKLLNLLHLIFMELKTSEEKGKILRKEYDLEISEDMKEELEKMGGLMEPLLEIATEKAAKEAAEKATAKATAETEIKSRLEDIRSLMQTLNFTAQQAMDALQISADKQKEYYSLI